MEMECGVFGEDILVEILSRLPKKYLFRFRCVSKGWLHLLSDRSRISPTTTDTGLLLQYASRISSTFDPSMTFLRVTDDADAASVVHSLGFSLDLGFSPIDSCNGLLLLAECTGRNAISSYVVYNPATKHSEHVPPPCRDESFFQVGFAFDGRHYQLICLSPKALDLHIFSSQTGKWRVKHLEIPSPFDVRQALLFLSLPNKSSFLRGAVHWLMGGSLFIYHLKDEHLKVVELPSIDSGFRHCIWNSEGCLNYCQCSRKRIYIWVLHMADFKWLPKHNSAFKDPMPDPLDWYKRCALDSQFEDEFLKAFSFLQQYRPYNENIEILATPMSDIHPCAFDDDFEIVYLKNQGRLFAYKLETEVMKEVHINPFEVPDNNKSIFEVFPFLFYKPVDYTQ